MGISFGRWIGAEEDLSTSNIWPCDSDIRWLSPKELGRKRLNPIFHRCHWEGVHIVQSWVRCIAACWWRSSRTGIELARRCALCWWSVHGSYNLSVPTMLSANGEFWGTSPTFPRLVIRRSRKHHRVSGGGQGIIECPDIDLCPAVVIG